MSCIDAEIYRAHSSCCEGYLTCGWISGVGIGHYHPRHTLRVYTADEDALPDIPEYYGPYRCERVLFGAASIRRSFTQERVRPVLGGLSVAPVRAKWAGTLGSAVYCKDNHAKLFLSNWHVLAFSNDAPIGLPLMQPASIDGGKAPQDVFGELNRYALVLRPQDGMNLVDAAAGFPWDARMLSDEIYQIGRVRYFTEPKVGMKVALSGRDGYSEGTVIDVDATMKVHGYPWGYSIFTDQVVIDPAIEGAGDSGSVIVDRGTNAVVALAFAGSGLLSLGNRASNVSKTLSVDWS